MDKLAFELFAKAYPHEAYAKWPNKFFKFFKQYYPLIAKKEMVKILKRTGESRRRIKNEQRP
jgi:hypothetical protein